MSAVSVASPTVDCMTFHVCPHLNWPPSRLGWRCPAWGGGEGDGVGGNVQQGGRVFPRNRLMGMCHG